jgi:hypothetical protein
VCVCVCVRVHVLQRSRLVVCTHLQERWVHVA